MKYGTHLQEKVGGCADDKIKGEKCLTQLFTVKLITK